MRSTVSRVAAIGAFASLLAFTAAQVDARGGGGRGGSTSMGRGGGGGGGFNRGGGGGGGGGFNRGGGGGGMNAGGFSRGGNYSSAGAGNRGNVNAGNVNRGNVNTGNINRGNVNTGNINTGNINRGNINTGNINTGNVNVNVDNNYGCCHGGWNDYPVGAGLAVGAVAGMTAAAIGSRYYALPPACSPYPYSGYTYYSCGGAYYKPTYQGDTVVYVVVDKP
jgi:hypothetical protein